MKKIFRIIIPVVVLLVTIFALSGTAFAAGPPDVVTIDWSGTGVVNGNVNATGDMVYNFATSGLGISGSFVMTNYLDNPYNYQVNSTKAEFISHVSGGSTVYTTTRTDSCLSYGVAGQNTYSLIGATSDGSADMALWTNSNFASLQIANYGHAWTPGGDTFTASANLFQILHTVFDSEGDYAQINSYGSGSAKIDAMSSDLGASSLTFAKGAGCYTDASFDGTGVQTLDFSASGHTSVSQFGLTVPGNGSGGSAYLNLIINFNGTFNVPDFSAGVN